ncbi:hypothetical protein BH23BAC4_BH23BAC4_01080 [soil metagenome]
MPRKDPVKLTLLVERHVAEAAKRYAKEKGTSVSKIVESHLDEVSTDPPTDASSQRAIYDEAWLQSLSPVVRKLVGCAKPPDGSPEPTKEDYIDYLEQKYR